MNNDPLDNEVSFRIGVTARVGLPVRVKGKAKSRFISAIDRLGGNIIDLPNAWLEAGPAKKRAKTKVAVQAILNKNIQINEPFIQAAVDNTINQAVRQHEKKILLLQKAMEDLEQRPPNAEESVNGVEVLDKGFLNRLEKRAEEEIRIKWGKVLAGEIRKPGTFSAKIIRVVDELEPKTAELFETNSYDI